MFRILRRGVKANGCITALYFRGTDFGLFRELLQTIPWDTAPDRRLQDGYLIFRDQLQAKEWFIPLNRRSSTVNTRHSWMKKKLLD